MAIAFSFLDPPVLTCSTLYVDHLHDDCDSYPHNEHLASWWWCGEYCEGIIALFSNQMNKNINKKIINHTVYCEGIIVGPSITAQYQCQARHSTTPINRLSAFLGSNWNNYLIMVRAWIRVLKDSFARDKIFPKRGDKCALPLKSRENLIKFYEIFFYAKFFTRGKNVPLNC